MMDDKNDIVITGMSGRFPECNNVDEFREALYNGLNLTSKDDRRFPTAIPGISQWTGKIPELDKFDAQYFDVHYKQAHVADPRHRILLETVFEAIVDAGYNPGEIRGSKTGVFVGLTSFTSLEEMRSEHDHYGYINLGVGLYGAANRISRAFDLKGPSISMDTACSSSMYCMISAFEKMKSGEIDSAIACGTHIVLHPHDNIEYNKLNVLSKDRCTRVFSEKRNGFVRSEAVCCVFMQKKRDSRRIYATVLGARGNSNGYVEEGFTFPGTQGQLRLLKEIYSVFNIDPDDVAYAELHGTGTLHGDSKECSMISQMFFDNGRKQPLLLGSVKSNTGHCENAAALVGTIKVIMSMETGIIPRNINAEPIDKKLAGVSDGKLKVVTENTQMPSGLVGINSFGIGGTNAHIVLKPNDKITKLTVKHKHRLVQVSGRTEEAVHYFLNGIEKNRNDEEFLGLIDEIHKINVDKHIFRGYAVLGETSIRNVSKYKSEGRPVVFIYSGLSTQWHGMGRELMSFEVFRNTFNRCAEAVKPYGMELVDLIMNGSEEEIFNIKNTFVAIAAIQLGLTDLLLSLGITPDLFAGHSSGETVCAYVNGDLTPEQSVLLAYARGDSVEKVETLPGQMAAIGMSVEDVEKILPEGVYVACQNSKNNVTISGPAERTREFVKKLKDQDIFAHLINSGGKAFHSKYIHDCSPHQLEFSRKVITDPKPRSEKWISTSVPADKLNECWAKYNCAEYQNNNFRNRVLFDQIFDKIPKNAIVIEIAPHGIFQSILKRELGPDNTIITLTKKTAEDQQQFLLSAIGQIYNAGAQPNLRNLYKDIVFPVSRGTSMINSLVKWDHSATWFVPFWKNKDAFGQVVKVNLAQESNAYLKGHNIDGRIMMPAFAYAEMVWKVLSENLLKDQYKLPVVFEDIKFLRATILSETGTIEFLVNIMNHTGYFEIYEGGGIVCSGKVRVPNNVNNEFKSNEELFKILQDVPKCSKEDFYKDARLRRMLYSGVFQGVVETDVNGNRGIVEWMGQYSGFLDSMCQLTMNQNHTKNLILPKSIKKLTIDTETFMEKVAVNKYVTVNRSSCPQITRTEGIEIVGLTYDQAPKREKTHPDPQLDTYEFVPYDCSSNVRYDLKTLFKIALQIILQNTKGLVKALSICDVDEKQEEPENILKLRKEIIVLLEKQTSDIEYINKTFAEIDSKYDALILTDNILKTFELIQLREHLAENGGYVIYLGQTEHAQFEEMDIIFKSPSLYLLKSKLDFPLSYDVINVTNSSLKWLEPLKQVAEKDSKHVAFLYNQNEETNGVVGLLRCLMTENVYVNFKAVLIHENAETFSVDNEFYRRQLEKLLSINVLEGDTWGTLVNIPLEEVKLETVNNATVSIQSTGNAAFNWIQAPKITSSDHNSSEIVNVHFTGLNTLDTLISVSNVRLPAESPTDSETDLGFEYSGITQTGKKVMGIVSRRALSSQVVSDPDLMWVVPSSWSLEEAATVPVVYSLCYQSIVMRGNIDQDEVILIYAPPEFGMAALSVARTFNAVIFMCVHTNKEKEVINKWLPQIQVGLTQDSSFPDFIRKQTGGKGVDLILSTFDDAFFEKSLNLLSTNGRILDLSKVDSSEAITIDPKILYQYDYHCISLRTLLKEKSRTKNKLRILIEKGLSSGVVKPFHSIIFKATEVAAAFKRLAVSRNTEKVLIKLVNELKPGILAYPKIYFDPTKTYIIFGGLGGMGLELTDWMLKKGATKVILNGRRPVWNGYQALCMKKWSQFKNVNISIDTNDASTPTGAEKMIENAQKKGPLGGIFNLAMVLRDTNLINQTVANFEAVFKPKINLSENLDRITRKMCPTLDHFVLFSSIVSSRGNLGQTNYGMANAAMDNLCEKRRREGFPGLAVQWGPVADVGALSSLAEEQEFLRMIPQRINSCFDALEKLMLQKVIVGVSTVISDRKKIISTRNNQSPASVVANILGIEDIDSIEKSSSLSELGLDSLMITEIKQTLYRSFQLEFGLDEIRNLTLEYLSNIEVTQTKSTTVSTTYRSDPQTSVSKKPLSLPLLNNNPIVNLNRAVVSGLPNVFLLPSIQGHIDSLEALGKSIKTTVYGLPCTKQTNFNTIEETARYFIKMIKNNQTQGPYFLVGYSYGAVVSFEIGLKLEEEGNEVHLLLIDGAPDYARNSITDIPTLQNRVLTIFASFFAEVNRDQASVIVESPLEFEQKLNSISKLICQASKLKLEEVQYAAECYWNRHRSWFVYKPNQKLKEKLLLIRRAHTEFETDDYGLQKYCQQKVDVNKLNGDHFTILLGDNLVEMTKIVKEWYESRNKLFHM